MSTYMFVVIVQTFYDFFFFFCNVQVRFRSGVDSANAALKIRIFFETIFIEISYCFVASNVWRCVLHGICPGVREPKLYHQTRSSFFVDVLLFHGIVVYVFKHENIHKFSFFFSLLTKTSLNVF